MDLGPARRTSGVRTGGRSERVVTAVLEATLAELASVGYGSLRLEDVASRAGVAKTTVYRRWSSKVELVSEAFRSVSVWQEPLPDTGTVRGDIHALLDRNITFCRTEQGRAIARVMTTDHGDEEFERIARALRDEARAYRGRVVETAIARGELPEGTDPTIVMDCIWSPIMLRIIKYGENVDRKTRDLVVDLVVTGVQHGAGVKSR